MVKKRYVAWMMVAALVGLSATGCVSRLLGSRGGESRDDIALRFNPSSPFGPGSEGAAAAASGAQAAAGAGREASAVPVYHLSIGDSVVIVLRTPDEQQFQLNVDENGMIKMPLLDPIKADGLTMAQLENTIQSQYLERKIYRYVNVNVFVPSRSYFVRGEVRQPGRYPLTSGITVLQALAAAGGYTDFANLRRIQILRGGTTIDVDAKEFERNPQKDIPIEDGDIIIVPRSFLG